MSLRMNTYEADVKVGSGQTKVSIESDNWSHAKELLERQYGRGYVMNVRQVSR